LHCVVEKDSFLSVPPTSPVDEKDDWTAFPTSLGWMAMRFRGDAVICLTFGHRSAAAAARAIGCQGKPAVALDDHPMSGLVTRLQAFADGEPDDLKDVKLDFSRLTPFQQRVISACRRIPWGKTVTYAELAAQAGSPRAARAVGSAMAKNPFPLIVPCHRVVGCGGSLGGYSAPGGIRVKQRLLQREAASGG